MKYYVGDVVSTPMVSGELLITTITGIEGVSDRGEIMYNIAAGGWKTARNLTLVHRPIVNKIQEKAEKEVKYMDKLIIGLVIAAMGYYFLVK